MNATMQTKVNKPNTYGQDKVQAQSPKAPPEKKFRAGTISATVWNNQSVKDGKLNEYKTVSFERSFKDPQGNWKTTHSLRVMDIPKAELVLRKAFEYLSMNDAETQKPAMMDEEIVY